MYWKYNTFDVGVMCLYLNQEKEQHKQHSNIVHY